MSHPPRARSEPVGPAELPDPPESQELPEGAGPIVRVAYRAAFHGRPADGVAALSSHGAHPRAVDLAAARWLRGVCLGAQGRYQRAAEVLLDSESGPDSLAASTRASHLRQLGRHAEAEPLDTVAVTLARTSSRPDTALADALVGLVADAVGQADHALAASRLATARKHVTGLDPVAHWRAHVRLDWVAAEHAMLAGRPAAARDHAGAALRRSRRASAPRHRAKSLLVLGVAGHLLDRPEAARLLATAAERADRLGVPTLVWPARLVLAQALAPTDPRASGLARAGAEAVLRTIAAQLPPDEGKRFLAAQGTTPT